MSEDTQPPCCVRCGHSSGRHGPEAGGCIECPCVMTPGSVSAVPNTPGTPRRTIRVADALWEAAADKAAERGENLSDVLRKALERYVRRK